MVTNVGTFGLAQAHAPLVPFSRTPLVVLVGEVRTSRWRRTGAWSSVPS